VDAAIIAAPSSTKDEDKAREPGMHQTRKGRWYSFGAKAYPGPSAGYVGAHKRKGPKVQWRIASKRSMVTEMEAGPPKDLSARREHLEARIRARVEHPFCIPKDVLGHRALRDRDLKKNAVQREALFVLVDPVIAKKVQLA
jgi:transposase, IS5 family